MPIATAAAYGEMLDRAKSSRFAYAAINVSSSQMLNAALRGFAEAESDGIIQISTGGAEFLSGTAVSDMVAGATALAEYAHVVARNCPVHVALHTDHCPPDKLDRFVRPLLATSRERVARGEEPLFQSHMWDGSALDLEQNLGIAADLLQRCREAKAILEIEIGAVGGEEDGTVGALNERLYSTPDEAMRVAETLGTGENGRYLLAATFGNVHGVYAPGHVKLRPSILKDIQDSVGAKIGKAKPFDFVFHGGSGSALADIQETLEYGVVKMNVDTDTQYAFTRAIVDHLFRNYAGALKIDGGIGTKKVYDPRAYGKAAEQSMATRVSQLCRELRSAGRTLA